MGTAWVTERKHGEMAFMHLVEGKDPSFYTQYYWMSLFAIITPAEKRKIPA